MTESAGFQEIVPDLPCSTEWKTVTLNTGAFQSTLQDIKVPEYGGGYIYRGRSPATFNRYIFWRVTDDCVELWEQSLDIDLTHNHVFLRIVGLPILEGISIHEDEGKRVIILVATIASTHSFCLPHPDTLHQSGDGQTRPSILRDLDQHTLRDLHTVHLLLAPAVEGGRAHTACSTLVGDTALFLFAQPDAGLLLLSMPATGVSSNGAVAAKVTLIKKSSLVNRLLMGFVPGMFRSGDCGITSLCCAVGSGAVQPQQGYALGVCGDGRMRMWCLQRCECVVLYDTLEDTAEAATRSTAAGRHRVVCRMTGPREAMVAVLLSFAEKQLLLLYGLALPPAGADLTPPTLSHVKTLYPPQYHLVDMSLTSSHVWTLWTDTNNENQVLYSSVGPSSVGFTAAVLQAGPEGRVPVSDSGLSPRELYTQQLFSPYCFTRPTLARALAIYRSDGGATATASSTSGGGVAVLQEEVEAVLQVAVQAKLPPHAEPQQLYEATLDTWEDFYSHALQYHQVGQKPLGLACGGCGAVMLVRRQSVAWLGEMEPVDAVVAAALAAQNSQCLTQVVARVGGGTLLRGDGSAAASVAGVLRCVAAVRRLVDADVAAAFLLDMAHHRHPEQVAEDMAASLLGQVVGGDEVSSVISSVVCSVPNFTGGLRLLVQALNFDGTTATSPAASVTPSDEPRRGQLWCSLVSASLHQLASSRLLLCRDVLVLQQMVLQLAHLCQLSPDSVGQLRTSLVQDAVLLSRAFHAFLCLSRAPAATPSAAHLHAVNRVAAALGVAAGASPLTRLPHTALCAALCQGAGPHVSLPGAVWARDGLEAVRAVAREAWPLQDRRGSTALLEALVFGGQSEAALHYIRQVCGWCEWSLCSRHFLLGVCLLLQGQARKAARFLHEAGEGCGAEELLGERVGGGGDSARLNYTLRLVRLFELFQQPSLALRLADNALCVAQDSAQHTAQLYAVLFKHHLALHHHDEAFTALQANPDPGPQRACLRQLLVALHTRGHIDTLVKYEYGKLTSEVITILENRARSADILVNNYYHLLYAFHVRKHNYKRAASVMYECASRLSTEAVGERGLKQQLKCYLAAINCLKLLPPDIAWILKPGPAVPVEGEAAPSAGVTEESGKRCVGGSRVCRRAAPRARHTVNVLELCHLQREYRLLHARLTLAAVSGTHDTPGTVTDASSTVSLLCHGQLYREAAGVCRLFSLSLYPVVQSLAAACVAADLSSDRQQQTAWLRHNDITIPTGWWELLRWLVCEEGRDSSELLQCAAEAVLERDHHLPSWLLSTYTRRDCNGFLRVLLRYGRLEAASTLALQLLDALTTGHCAGQFGLEGAVHITSPPVCLSYTALDHLLLELNHNKHQLYYDKVLTQLQQKLQLYQTEVARVSRDRVLLQQ